MKRIGVIIVLFIVGVGALGTVYFYLLPENNISQVWNALPTSIRIERDTLTLGTVKYGEKRKIAFQIHNRGDEPLLVHDVQPSCGCTGVEWSRKPVRPGGTVAIHIVFEPNSLGRFMKSIDVLCNTAQHMHKLHLRGEVVE